MRQPVWEIAVHLAVAGDVFDGVFLCRPFSHEMSWMGSGTYLIQFLRGFLPTLDCKSHVNSSLFDLQAPSFASSSLYKSAFRDLYM